MKNVLMLCLFTCVLHLGVADVARFATITAYSERDGSYTTNQVSISPFETAEVVSLVSQGGSGAFQYYLKDGLLFNGLFSNNPGNPPVVVQGPATFFIVAQHQNCRALLTLKVTPQAFGPDKTLIIPAGTNQVLVHLECSTNLLYWSAATNGIYGSATEAKFFRIKAEQVR